MPGSAFGAVARALAAASRAEGLTAPAFRSPPGVGGAARTARRLSPDAVLVAVERRGRPAAEVIDDMVAGVVRANGKPAGTPEVVARLRRAALDALLAHDEVVPGVGLEPTCPRKDRGV